MPDTTWAMNTVVPAHAAERYKGSLWSFSRRGVSHPLASVQGRGAIESDPLGPPGDYANSCVGRERVFSYFARQIARPRRFTA